MSTRKAALLSAVAVLMVAAIADPASAGLLFGRSNSPGHEFKPRDSFNSHVIVVQDYSTTNYVAISQSGRAIIKRNNRLTGMFRRDSTGEDSGASSGIIGGIIGGLVGKLLPGGGDDPDDGGGGLPFP